MGEEPAGAGWARWAEIGGSAQPGSPLVQGEETESGPWRAVAPGVLGRPDRMEVQPAQRRPGSADPLGSRVRDLPQDPARGSEHGAGPGDLRRLRDGGGRGRLRPEGDARRFARVGGVVGAVVVVLALARIAGAAPGMRVSVPAPEPSAGISRGSTSAGDRAGSVDSGVAGEWEAAGEVGRAGAAQADDSPSPPVGGIDGFLGDGEETPNDWWAVLDELDRARSRALVEREPMDLATYAAPGSAMWAQDTALIEGLLARGLTPLGLGTRLIAIEQAPEPDGVGHSAYPSLGSESTGDEAGPGPNSGPAGDVVLVIVDERSAYTLEDAEGVVAQRVPASGLRRWRVALVPAAGRPDGSDRPDGPDGPAWRIRSVEAVP